MCKRDSSYVAILMDRHSVLISLARFQVDDVATYPTEVRVSDLVKHGTVLAVTIKGALQTSEAKTGG